MIPVDENRSEAPGAPVERERGAPASAPLSKDGPRPDMAIEEQRGERPKHRIGSWLVLNFRAAIGRAYVRVVGANREPSWIISEALLPVLTLSAYVFVYRALEAPSEFVGFVVLGGTMTAYWMAVLWSMATQFAWEKGTGQLQLYLMAPAETVSVLFGMAAGGVLMTSTRAAASLVVGVILFGVEFQVSSWVMLIAAFVLTLVALYGLGMLMCSAFMVWGREAFHLENLMQEPVFLLSGFYFPVRRLGSAAAGVGSVIPLTLGLDAMRQLLFSAGAEHGWLPVRIELAILAGLGTLYVSAAVWLMMRLERRGREEGRLTIGWH